MYFHQMLNWLKEEKCLCGGEKPPILSACNWTSFVAISDVTLAHVQHCKKQTCELGLKDKHSVSHRVMEMRLGPNIYHQTVNTIRGESPLLICDDVRVMSWEPNTNTFINHVMVLTTIKEDQEQVTPVHSGLGSYTGTRVVFIIQIGYVYYQEAANQGSLNINKVTFVNWERSS